MAPDAQRGSELRVLVAGADGRPVSAPGLARWLARVAPVQARGSVGVALVGDARIRALNKRYLKRDYATDVLSFPMFARPRTQRATAPLDLPLRRRAGPQDPSRVRAGSCETDDRAYLGDIVIARGAARRQARAAGHSERTELRILALHGLLHLLGYDHELDGGAMARVERSLRRKGGLPSGLIERGRPVLNTPSPASNASGARVARAPRP